MASFSQSLSSLGLFQNTFLSLLRTSQAGPALFIIIVSYPTDIFPLCTASLGQASGTCRKETWVCISFPCLPSAKILSPSGDSVGCAERRVKSDNHLLTGVALASLSCCHLSGETIRMELMPLSGAWMDRLLKFSKGCVSFMGDPHLVPSSASPYFCTAGWAPEMPLPAAPFQAKLAGSANPSPPSPHPSLRKGAPVCSLAGTPMAERPSPQPLPDFRQASGPWPYPRKGIAVLLASGQPLTTCPFSSSLSAYIVV